MLVQDYLVLERSVLSVPLVGVQAVTSVAEILTRRPSAGSGPSFLDSGIANELGCRLSPVMHYWLSRSRVS